MVFLKQFTDAPVQALQRAKEVLDIYLQLITQTHTTVNWSCATEYNNYTTTAVITEQPSTGTHKTNRLHVVAHDTTVLLDSYVRPVIVCSERP